MSQRDDIQKVVTGALDLVGADRSELEDSVLQARLPQPAQPIFGNRSTIRYTFDRITRQFHDDVEYAAVGSALLTQSINAIRDNVSVVAARPPAIARDAASALGDLVQPPLSLEGIRVDSAEAWRYARAEVRVTMHSDDHRSFLHHLVVPLSGAPVTAEAQRLLDTSEAAEVDIQSIGVDVDQVIEAVLTAAERSIQADVTARESEVEAHLQDYFRRLGAGRQLDRLKQEFALRVELDVAYLQIVELSRDRLRGIVVDRLSNIAVPLVLETFADDTKWSPTAPCKACGEPTALIKLCGNGEGHLTCLACARSCVRCAAPRCRSHPLSHCNARTCDDQFCDSCVAQCADCDELTCALHKATCRRCQLAGCANCISECADEPGAAVHLSHLTPCAECGRAVCADHSIVCRFSHTEGLRHCAAHTRVCQVDAHQAGACTAHVVACSICQTPACPDHGAACADCGRFGCTAHLTRCAPGGEWALTTHQRACAECGASACGKHSGTCSACAETYCSNHLSSCSVEGHQVCARDGTTCSECGEVACPDHISVCATGRHPVCARSQCRAVCVDGQEVVCKTHAIQCDIGPDQLCGTHVIRCHSGGERTCERHRSQCESCARPFCGKHGSACAICDRPDLCTACVTTTVLAGDSFGVCAPCSTAHQLGGAPVLERPLVERLFDRSPPISATEHLYTVVSISPFRAYTYVYALNGELLGRRRLSRKMAADYRRSVQLRES